MIRAAVMDGSDDGHVAQDGVISRSLECNYNDTYDAMVEVYEYKYSVLYHNYVIIMTPS